MNILNNTVELQKLDAAHHLHPFTDTGQLNNKGARVITSANGCHLTDSDGNRILDGMAGLWCTAIGYGRKEIAEAANLQMEKLPYYNTFFQTTHQPVIELSNLLSELTPPQFEHFFFTSSGSESNDTILKIAKYYWELKGKPDRNIFISRRGGYHGSTVASAALGGFDAMHAQQGVPVANIHHAPPPSWWAEGGDHSREEFGVKIAEDTLAMIDEIGSERVAAFIGEPIMGAGGVIIPPDTYWPTLAPGLKERGILLISDEVICGFGRTGNWFGCETYGTEPDFMPMAKGLSSGYLPIGAVAVAKHIVDVLIEDGDEFVHGYTYSGHPVSCAAAIANLNIMRDEKIVDHVRDEIGPYLQEKWRAFSDHPLVGEAVMTGLVGAMQLAKDKASRSAFDSKLEVGMMCREHSFKNGLIMRAVSDRMIVAPPLVLTKQDADELIDKASRTLDMTLSDLKAQGLM